ncbi:MAG: TonB family protein [Desulfobaccales bacterium]
MRLWRHPETGVFPGGLMISLGMHVLLAALVWYAGGLQKPAAPPVLTVSLVAPGSVQPGSGGDREAAAAKPGKAHTLGSAAAPRKQKPAPNNPLRKKAPAPEAPDPEKSWAAVPLRPTPPQPVRAPAAPARTALSTPPSAAGGSSLNPGGSAAGTTGAAGPSQAGSGVAGAGGGTSGGSGGSRGDGQGDGQGLGQVQRQYLNLVRARILAQRTYPLLARQRRQEGTVRLRFTLSPAGHLAEGVQVVKPSGFALLDEQARHCVLTAAPFPPFPQELKRPSLTVELPIVYKLTDLGT